MLNHLLGKETGRCWSFPAPSAARTHYQEPESRRHQRRHDSRRSLAIAAHRRPRGFQRGRFRVLVATDSRPRIHVQDIVHVINYDLPEVAENFIHRVGRTAVQWQRRSLNPFR